MPRWLLSLLLLVLLPLAAQAACTTAQMSVGGVGNIPPRYFRCDTYGSRPTSGLTAGDTLYTIDTGYAYVAANATTWVAQSAGGAPGASASTYWRGDGAWHTPTGPVFHVTNYGAKCDGTTDDSTAVINAIAAAMTWASAAGGVVEFPAGSCVITQQLLLPTDGVTGAQPHQKPLRLTGQTAAKVGQQQTTQGGTVLLMSYQVGSGAKAKLDTRGAGSLEIDHLTFQDTSVSPYDTPFIHTTNTILYVHDNRFYGNSAVAQTTSVQDAIVLGDTNAGGTVPGDQFGAAFQGYGTVIERNQFDRVRRAVFIQASGNASVIANNDVRRNAGSNLTTALTGAAWNGTLGQTVFTLTAHGFPVGKSVAMAFTGFTGANWGTLNTILSATFLDANTFQVGTCPGGPPPPATCAGSAAINSSTWGAMTGSPVFLSGAAFESLGNGAVAGGLASGNVFTGNLVEMDGYAYAFKAAQGSNNFYSGNSLYDGSVGTSLAGYRFEPTALNNTVLPARRSGTMSLVVVDAAVPVSSLVLDGSAGGTQTLPNPATFGKAPVIDLADTGHTIAAPSGATALQIQTTGAPGAGAGPGQIVLYAFADAQAAGFQFRRGRGYAPGIATGPTAVQQGNTLGAFAFQGHDGVAMSTTQAQVLGQAAEAWDATHHGTMLTFNTTPTGGSTAMNTRMQLLQGLLLPVSSLVSGTLIDPGVGTINLSGGYYVNNVALAASHLSNGVTGAGPVVLATSPTLTTPTIAALANLTSNGFVQTSGGVGTLVVLADPLGVTHGGTGTASPFTDGAVVFAGASGVYSQDTANLVWDRTNLRLGVGINPAVASGLLCASLLCGPLHVASQLSPGPAAVFDQYSANATGPALRGRKFRGASALTTPPALRALANDILLTLSGSGGYAADNVTAATAGADVAQIRARAAEDFAGTANQGTYWELRTTPTGSATIATRALVDAVGTVIIGASLPTTGLAGGLLSKGVAFASLGTPDNGMIVFCTDCDPATAIDQTCASAGAKTGALAFRVNGVWKCVS